MNNVTWNSFDDEKSGRNRSIPKRLFTLIIRVLHLHMWYNHFNKLIKLTLHCVQILEQEDNFKDPIKGRQNSRTGTCVWYYYSSDFMYFSLGWLINLHFASKVISLMGASRYSQRK